MGIVFDMDGTLLDSVGGLTRALNALLNEEGLGPLSTSEVGTMVGEGAGKLVDQAFMARNAIVTDNDLNRQAARLQRFLDIYGQNPIEGTSLYPGALDLLVALKTMGLPLGICTNKPEAPARTLCEACGLDPYIDALVGGDTLPQRKPDPAPLLLTLERLRLSPDETLYVGDSAIDVACARAAGLPVVLLAHGYSNAPVRELGADAVFDDFAALSTWLGYPG